MKVKILSGNQKGQVIEQSRPEAEANIDAGFACAVDAPETAVEAPEPVEAPMLFVVKEEHGVVKK